MAGERSARAFALAAGAWLAAPGALLSAEGDHPSFTTADSCLACHGEVVGSDGHAVSIAGAWRATMMANSARDPYWQAGVRRELVDHPHLREEIEDTCSVCHMPMARTMAKADGRSGEIFAHLAGTADDPEETRVAWDGVSCTLCHQILPDHLGEEASFGGGYRVAAAAGSPRVFGPFEVDAGRRRIMESATGYAPEQSTHVQESELCATCHTLFTPARDGAGEVVGEFPEQVPYLEWRNSRYAGTQSCQDCHMPEATAPISAVLGEMREGVSQHAFRGGNAFMLKMLDRHREELGVTAPSADLQAAAATTLAHLQESTARIDVGAAERDGNALVVPVRVQNLAGHKLPTAYPSRRVWIHLAVRDASGAIVFESGRPLPDGSIAGNDNDAAPGTWEPHHEEIASGDDVQIYEPIILDHAGGVTTSLLSAFRYAKDNRLLPEGFETAGSDGSVAVRGAAASDADFAAGGDTVRYRVRLEGAHMPVTLTARLLFQTIGYRWARNLESYETHETDRFLRYYGAAAGESGVVLAESERRLP